MTENIKLHLGPGSRHIPGFIHIDIEAWPHVDHVAPVERLPFITDDSVSLIYACHLLEHFGRNEVEAVLKEWLRILKPGGVLRLAVPDFAACANLYYERGIEDGLNGLVGLICGGQRNEYDFHKMVFDQHFLTVLLLKAGFKEVRSWDWRTTEHAHVDDYSQAYIPHMDKEKGTLMSLNLEAIK